LISSSADTALSERSWEPMSVDNILALRRITKSFFGAEVLHGIDLEVVRGEVLGLVGENGAGKSTLMNILGGVWTRDSGSMELNGHTFEPANPKEAQRAGIAFIHQELSLFSNLTVAENIFIDELPTGPLWSVQYATMRAKAQEYLDTFGVQTTPGAKIGSVSMGVRQTVEVTKALIKKAQIIIFDEPTTSLSQKEKENLFKVIDHLHREGGITVIYISHILEDVFSLCERIAVLRDGALVGVEQTARLTKPQVIKMMVGRDLEQIYPQVEKKIGDVVFHARDITQGKAVQRVSLELRAGEIVGLFGLMGAGRTELVRCLFGVDKMDTGEITFHGRRMKSISPDVCIRSGMAFVTEDRRQEGLLMPKPVKDNLVVVILDRLRQLLGMVSRGRESQESEKVIEDLNIKVYDKNRQEVKSLSGGNQQKVVIGKWILGRPSMFILDEPTRGVDVGAKHEIYVIINDMARNGATVLFVSSEMEELMGVCDRIMVIHTGRIVADFAKGEYDQERIMSFALGGDGS
jgi:ribose transport system ATP-binding protein